MKKEKISGFQKGNTHGFKPVRSQPLDSRNLQVKLEMGMLDRVKAIEGWQDEIRALVKEYLESKEAP